MYAVIQQGSKQYTVEKGKVYNLDRIDVAPGKEVAFKEVLLVADKKKYEIGKPYVKGAEVKATVVNEIKGKKVISYKFKRRKSQHRKKGHRQKYTRVEITEIKL